MLAQGGARVSRGAGSAFRRMRVRWFWIFTVGAPARQRQRCRRVGRRRELTAAQLDVMLAVGRRGLWPMRPRRRSTPVVE
ncbi:MAG: hypothetical protein HS111_13015 [Kofleriaceae bacterium]|nr:hypothetical protein [Kofleriaceae bacterium]